MIETFSDYQAGIARIYASETGKAGESICGSGFLVSDRYLLTCAHVVAEALKIPSSSDKPQSPIWIDFPTSNRQYQAHVVLWQPCPQIYKNSAYLDDIALLSLTETVDNPKILALHVQAEVHDKPFVVWGFPQPNGMESNGTIRAEQPGRSWYQLQVNPDHYPIYRGFSGSPLARKDKEHFFVVGMVNAAESNVNAQTNTGGQGAYAIAAKALSEIWMKQGVLISILSDCDPKTLRRAYQRSRRKQDWHTLERYHLHDLVPDLYVMDKAECQYLIRFAIHVLSQISEQDKRNSLRQYLREVFGLSDADIDSLAQRLQESSSQGTETQDALIPRLWLLLADTGTPNQYQLESAYLIGADAKEQKISVPAHEGILRADLTKQLLPILTDIIEVLPPLNQLWVEVFLPFKSLNLAPDCWQVEDDYDEEPFYLGSRYPVTVRVSERLGYKKTYKDFGKWNSHWNNKDLEIACEQALICGFSGPAIIINQLEQGLGCGVRSTIPLQEHEYKLPGLLMREGVPIALWTRQNCSDCEGHEHFDDLLQTLLNDLPQSLRAKRNEALNSSTHVARQMTLLWDNPKLVPSDAPAFNYPSM